MCPSGATRRCSIHWQQDAGSPKFFLTHSLEFGSLCDLITRYQEMLLRYSKFEMRLTELVPGASTRESKEWYHTNFTSTQAEYVLMWVSPDGMKGTSPAPTASPSGQNGRSISADCSRRVTFNKVKCMLFKFITCNKRLHSALTAESVSNCHS